MPRRVLRRSKFGKRRFARKRFGSRAGFRTWNSLTRHANFLASKIKRYAPELKHYFVPSPRGQDQSSDAFYIFHQQQVNHSRNLM
jgi:hypothetical protein